MEGGRDGGREGGREGGRDGGREGGRESSAHTSTWLERDGIGVFVDLGCRELTAEGGSRSFGVSKTSWKLSLHSPDPCSARCRR